MVGVLSIFLSAYVYYVKNDRYDRGDDVSYQFYLVIGIALLDFYTDVFFAQRAAGSEQSTVRTLGYVMLGWIVAVLALNGWVMTMAINHEMASDEDGNTFDQEHSGLYTIIALLTLTSAEMIAVFPWEEEGPNGFPDEETQFRAECAGWFEDIPQLLLQILVYSQGSDEGGAFIFCTALSVTALIVRTVMRRLEKKHSRRGARVHAPAHN